MKKLVLLLIILLSSAVYSADSSIEFADKDKELLFSKAMVLQSEKKYDESIRVLKSILPLEKNSEYVYYNIGLAYYKKLNFINTIKFSRKAIKINKNFTKPYVLIYEVNNSLKNYKEASLILSELIEYNPDQEKYLFQLAVINYHSLKNYNLSAYYLNKILDLSKKKSFQNYYLENANLMLMDINFRRGFYKDSIENLNQAIKINHNNNIKFFTLGSKLYSEHKINHAVISFQNMIDNLTPKQKRSKYLKKLYSLQGQLYFVKGDPRAMTYLRLGSGEEEGSEYISRSLFKYLMGKDAEALIRLNHSLKKFPNNIAALVAYGKLSHERGKKEEAKEYYEKALKIIDPKKTDLLTATDNIYNQLLKLSPEDKSIFLKKARLYERFGKLNTAIVYYKKYLSTIENLSTIKNMKEFENLADLEYLVYTAYLYSRVGKEESSKKFFAKAHRINPPYHRRFFLEGIAELNKKNYQQAEKLFKRSTELNKKNHFYWFYYGISLEKQKKTSEAIKHLKTSLKLDSNNHSYQNYLGYIYAEQNQNMEEARKLITSAVNQRPFNGAYLDSLGWVYYREGDFDKALQYLINAKINLEAAGVIDPVMYDHLGDVYHQLKDDSLALKYWRKSIKIKNDPVILKKINNIK